MNRWRSLGLIGWLVVAGSLGCATSALPPSEATMSIVRSYQDQLGSRVSSGHLTRAQARDLLYARLVGIQPPLPALNELLEFRKQVTARVEDKTLTPEQAEAQLTTRESEMLLNWEEMAAKYAQEQRNVQRLQNEYERGYQGQKQMEQTIKTLPRSP